MASTFSFTARSLLLASALITATVLAGCQAQKSIVDNLPAPNFNGPVVNAPPTPAPTAVNPPTTVTPASPKAVPDKQLTAIPREWIPRVAPRPWKWIVIHHSATPAGSAAVFDKMHRDKGWDELGYDFVIGNGTDSGNGQIEVGPRWPKQKWGAHAKTPDNRYNERGIGICLVGNFDTRKPTAEQTRALTRLVAYLMKTYKIAPQDVIGHGDTKATDCPGRYMNVASIRRAAAQMLADGGAGSEIPLADAQAASSGISPDVATPE